MAHGIPWRQSYSLDRFDKRAVKKKHIKTPVTPLSYELQKYGAMHDDAFINANMWGVILSAVEEKKVWLFDWWTSEFHSIIPRLNLGQATSYLKVIYISSIVSSFMQHTLWEQIYQNI